MRFRRSAAVAGSLLLATATAHAVVPPSHTAKRIRAEELTALPGAGITKPLRQLRGWKVAERSSAAWSKFTSAKPGAWQVAWDPATGVPNRIWGAGIPALGASAFAPLAEQFARDTLAMHLDLLAPGARITDFRLVTNHEHDGLRTIGFVQERDGRRVVGGQVSFRFKNDRLFVIASEALPDVSVAAPSAGSKMNPAALLARSTDVLRRDFALANAPVRAVGGEVILPLVGEDSVLGYRVVVPMEIDGGADGKYLVYVDPSSGATIATRQMNTYASGTVLYKSVDRNPLRTRKDVPARKANVNVGGVEQTTDMSGRVTWTPDVPQLVKTAVVGPLVAISNQGASMGLTSAEMQLAPNGTIVWDASAIPEDDAQVQTFLATNIVKEYVRTIDPMLPGLDEPLAANVNIPQSCNAFYNGTSINFFASSDRCENTGLLQDVVYHEYGHAFHTTSILEGVGTFDGAMSEGAADFLAASITNDSGMGRGFFKTEEALRELDPVDYEWRWPEDIAEIHHTGQIYGGTFWDLREALIAKHGATKGVQVTNKIFLGTLQRSTSIPASMIEALATDDDDGNLENGTPNECAIRDAYGRHGLRTATGVVSAPGAINVDQTETAVRLTMSGLSARCTGDEIDKVELEWKPGFTGVPAAGKVAMTQMQGAYFATMPLPMDEMMYYTARVTFRDGSVLRLADNLADPYYQLYQGKTVALYCWNFDDQNPLEHGWTVTSRDLAGNELPSIWEWGEPTASGGTDPHAAFSGTKILGQTIGGEYPAEYYTLLELPPIDLGQYSDVRLQYRRWLSVEDSFYDKASVTVNGRPAWTNFSADVGESSAIHHIDREWRFHDVRVSSFVFGHELRAGFQLSTDQGLHLGGWHLDDVCVVANPNSICGDGVKSPTEACDAGAANSNEPDAECRTYCRQSQCGDGIVDSGEACDDGFMGSEACTPECGLTDLAIEEGGCCSSSGGSAPLGAAGLSALAAMVMFRRRRRV